MIVDYDLAAHVTPADWADYLAKKSAGRVPPFRDFAGKPVPSPFQPRPSQTVAGGGR